MTDRELLAEALEVMLSAVNSGDWKVDGACDPNATIVRLTNRVRLPEHEFECPRCGHCCQQREWVELTDEEIFRLSERIECCKYSICAAEEKLKEKNCG